jgi:glutathione S-transferase
MLDGRTLVESGAILWYLAAGTPLLPDDPFHQGEVCRWLMEQSDVMPIIGGLRLVAGRYSIADIAVFAYSPYAPFVPGRGLFDIRAATEGWAAAAPGGPEAGS